VHERVGRPLGIASSRSWRDGGRRMVTDGICAARDDAGYEARAQLAVFAAATALARPVAGGAQGKRTPTWWARRRRHTRPPRRDPSRGSWRTTARFNGDEIHAIGKGMNILDHIRVSHMAQLQKMFDFPPAPKLNALGRLDPAKRRTVS